MTSVDCMSLYSVSTLVGGDDEEIVRAEERSQRLIEAEALRLQRAAASNSSSSSNRATSARNEQPTLERGFTYPSSSETLSRRDSVSTLVARPRAPPAQAPPVRSSSSYNSNTPSSSAAYRTINVSALSSPAAPDLRVAWWSPIVPNPSLGTSRSSDSNFSSSNNLNNNNNSNRLRMNQSAREQNADFPAATDYGARRNKSPPSRQASTSLSSPPAQRRMSAPSTSASVNTSPYRATSDSSASSFSSPSQRRTLEPRFVRGWEREDDEVAEEAASTTPCPPQLPSAYPLYAKCYCEENAYILAAYLDQTCRKWNERRASSTTTKVCRERWDVDVVLVSNKNRSVALWQQKAASTAESDYQVVWDYHVFVVVNYRRVSEARPSPPLPSSPSSPRTQRLSAFPRRGSAMSRIEEEAAAAAAAATASASAPAPSSAAVSSSASASAITSSHKRPEQSWVYDLDSRLASPAPLVEYLSSTFGLDNGLASQLPKRFQPLFRVISASDYFTRFGSDRSHMKKPDSSVGEWLSPRPEWDLLVGSKAVLSHSYFFDSFVDMRVKVGDGRFGTIVKLNDLLLGNGLGVGTDGRGTEEPPILAAGVAVLLANLPEMKYSASQDEAAAESTADSQEARRSTASGTSATTTTTTDGSPTPSPGVIIGGIQRYGMRPPPPPPDGAIIPPNRGKRITDPLFPAYIISAYEHRAA